MVSKMKRRIIGDNYKVKCRCGRKVFFFIPKTSDYWCCCSCGRDHYAPVKGWERE